MAQKKPLLYGIIGSAGLLILYGVILTVAESFEHAVTQFLDMPVWISLLVIGFGAQVGLFTAFVGIPILLLWQQLPAIAGLYSGIIEPNGFAGLVSFVFGVGLFEEMCKLTPLLVFGLRGNAVREPIDFCYMGILSGLGFALHEGVGYSLMYAEQAAEVGITAISEVIGEVTMSGGLSTLNSDEIIAQMNLGVSEVYGALVITQIVRLLVLPLLHASWAGVCGLALGYGGPQGRWGITWAAIISVSVLHGTYNWLSNVAPLLAIAIVGFSVLLLLLCLSKSSGGMSRGSDI